VQLGFHTRYAVLCRRGISWGKKKWWQPYPGIKYACSQMRQQEGSSLFLSGKGEDGIFFNYLVPIMFPMMLPSSQWVSIMFPKGVPNSTSLYLISFAQSSPLCHLYRWAQGEAHRSSILGSSHVSDFFQGEGLIKMAHCKRKKKKKPNLGNKLL